ncbi:esterase-like activity of phytase family protein [Aliikangiella maris]
MKKLLATSLAALLSASINAHQSMKIEFIGEATFATGYHYNGVQVGGLSGIDFDQANQSFIAISDDRGQLGPVRYYDLTIDLSDGYLNEGDIAFTGMTEILDKDGSSFAPASVDPESIRLLPFPGLLYWTSEGDAHQGVAPFVRIMTRSGQPVNEFELPEKFVPTGENGIRNNLAFESLTFSYSQKYLYTATENALVQDGAMATTERGSPVRVLQLDVAKGKAEKEFIYQTDPVAAPSVPADAFNTNGLVELLAVSPFQFIAVERSFSVGVGNSIKLYLTSTLGASNVSRLNSVEERRHVRHMKKRLLLDLADLGLTLDNIEGITFGPTLATGEKTLILVSDNNFNVNGQFTQFLAFKLN